MNILLAISLFMSILTLEEPVSRVAYPAVTISIPVTDFDSHENQYHTVNDYLALLDKPSMDGLKGSSGQLIVQDHGLTPGAVMTNDAKVVCGRSTKTVRNVSETEKKAVYQAYIRYYPEVKYVTSDYEVDHLVSLELGGSNSPKNLWPEYYNDPQGAHTKDKLENLLHRRVCSGQMSLQEAQYVIATDWRNAYEQYFGVRPK